MRRERFPADLRAVGAAQVLDADRAVVAHFQAGVLPRNRFVTQQNIGAFAPDHVQSGDQNMHRPPRLFQAYLLRRVGLRRRFKFRCCR